MQQNAILSNRLQSLCSELDFWRKEIIVWIVAKQSNIEEVWSADDDSTLKERKKESKK